MSIFYKLSVKEVKKETQDAVSIVFEIPKDLKNTFLFTAGQYITLEKEIEGKRVRRAYSICSSPKSGELRVAVKSVAKGLFSVYANTKLKAGDIIDVAAPEGKFILEPNSNHQKKHIAFAAGSGITPVISMVKSVLESEPQSKFILVYGNKSSEDTIFKKEIDNLSQNFEQFKVHYVFSQKISDKALFGRIDRETYSEIVKHRYHNDKFDNYFLCGPEQMIDSLKEAIQKSGIPEKAIKFELFNTTSHKKEINEDLSGNTKITVVLDDEETSFEMRKDEIILDAALAKGLDAPYSCQGGICSSCMAKVIEGEAVMDKNTILDADEVEEGLILTCQAHPVTPILKIDYDEV